MTRKGAEFVYPEVLQDLADQVAAYLVERGETAEEAARIGIGTAEHIRSKWGGGKIYIPKAQSARCSERDEEMFREWNGRNIGDLARKYGLSESRVYQIIGMILSRRPGKRRANVSPT